MLKLTEANLRALNEPSRSPSPPPVAPSPAAEIKATKFDLFATIKRLRHMGPKGLKLQREADVYIDDTGEVAYRGTDLAELDNPVFWRRQFDMMEPKCLALKRALFGPRAIYEPPKPLVIDQAAQAEQDRIDDYYFQLKRKLESWPFISSQPGQVPSRPPPSSTDTRRARRLSGMKRGLEDDEAASSSASTAPHKRRRSSVPEPEPLHIRPSSPKLQANAKRRSARTRDATRAMAGRQPRPGRRRSRRLAGQRPEYNALP
ncbi:hypothetical protein G6O67_005547 [Ophiocordyceps sinensis]|uniref:Uncharacterized protein n=1 Tax=Ophiocordyceps sinensis TaxID=72228 RepID=A0A8H4PRT7_9HYPO|nr:hypothetical protein G6O67_005547 [Ophiocordyceps sinensis]